MLGGLAKWLRAAGHDALYAAEGMDLSDRTLTRRAVDEERALLSSDRGFLERGVVRDGEVAFLLVPHLPVEEQLRMVAESFGLGRDTPRCMECNGALRVAGAGEVAPRVPSGVLERQERFFVCSWCARVFWYGSHWERIGGRLERVFG